MRLRVIAVALEPALALARIVALPLDELQELVATGYFREAKARGISLRAMARRFGKSLRTIATLSRRAADKGPLLGESRRLGWRRRIVARIADGGPASVEELRRELPDAEHDEVAEEIEQLVAEGILRRDAGQYAVSAALWSSVGGDVEQRIDSLRHFVSAITQVVYRRFFVADPQAEAFARVLSFAAEREELTRIRESTYEALRDRVVESDANASSSASAVSASVALCVVEAPSDHAWRPRR